MEAKLESGAVEKEAVIVQALEAPQYKWRTIRGVAKQTHLPEGEVRVLLRRLGEEGKVIQASIPNQDDEPLYTTRKHYRDMTSPVERVLLPVDPVIS